MPIARQREFVEKAIATPNVDPWILNMLGGRYHIHAAWDERGSGFTNTVTPQRWRGLESHLKRAQTYLLKAWELHPEYPEAAANLITVALGGVQNQGQDARFCFDQAVKAEFDYASGTMRA